MSRLDDIKKQNPALNINLLDLIATADPTKSYKYLGFLVKQLKSNITTPPLSVEENILRRLFGDNLSLFERFEEHCKENRIKNKDISNYKSFSEIEEEVELADEIKKANELEKQVVKLYETNEYLILLPLSYESSASYGSNTKWCITEKVNWDNYFGKYKLIFVINKLTNIKIAFSKENDDENRICAWNATDDEINPMLIDLPIDIFDVVRNELRKNSYETIEKHLGTDVILDVDDGIVSIEKSTDEQLTNFLDLFYGSISETLRSKIESHITKKKPRKKRIPIDYKTYGYDEIETIKHRFYNHRNGMIDRSYDGEGVIYRDMDGRTYKTVYDILSGEKIKKYL